MVLDAMRSGPDPPAAPLLFHQVGAVPVLTVFDVIESSVDLRRQKAGDGGQD
jgi:hypothetical protein